MRGKSAVRRWLSGGGLVVAKHASPPILMARSEPVLWCPRVHRVQVTAGWRELQTSEDTPSYTCPWSCCTLQELGNRLGGRDGWEKTNQQVGGNFCCQLTFIPKMTIRLRDIQTIFALSFKISLSALRRQWTRPLRVWWCSILVSDCSRIIGWWSGRRSAYFNYLIFKS